ncbi:MAG: GIY-YIG nuclease family protein, partial [Patescibacteria group bacterium]
MTRNELQKSKLPDKPGVYIFRGKGRKILYIGKATSLRDRLRSYFSSNIASIRSSAIAKMVEEARSISYKTTKSVLEALILEANLIKQHQPPYNLDEKDNKSWNYVVITKENFPRILLVRGRELFQTWKKSDILHAFGPYPHGTQ